MNDTTAIRNIGQPLRRREDFKFLAGKGLPSEITYMLSAEFGQLPTAYKFRVADANLKGQILSEKIYAKVKAAGHAAEVLKNL